MHLSKTIIRYEIYILPTAFFNNPSLNSIVGKALPCREWNGSPGEIWMPALPLSSFTLSLWCLALPRPSAGLWCSCAGRAMRDARPSSPWAVARACVLLTSRTTVRNQVPSLPLYVLGAVRLWSTKAWMLRFLELLVFNFVGWAWETAG